MNKTTRRALLKTLSAVTGNLSAAWFALVLVTPTFTSIFTLDTLRFLTQNIIMGILFFAITAIIERKLSR